MNKKTRRQTLSDFMKIQAMMPDSWASQGGKKLKELELGIFAISEEEHIKNATRGGTTQGNINKESGWASELGRKWGRTNMIEHMNKKVKCPLCKEITNIGNISRYHQNSECLERKEKELSILEMHKQGLSMKKIGESVGLSAASICLIIKKYKTSNN